MNKKIILILVLILASLLVTGRIISQKNKLDLAEEKSATNNELETTGLVDDKTKSDEQTPALIGGDKDSGGCLVAAGYSWCEPKVKCLRTWEERCFISDTDVEAIKQLFAEKYDKSFASVLLNITWDGDGLARGGVKFDSNGEGANFFAAKTGDNWRIVFDGNGGFSCDLLRDAGFPDEVIADCAQ